MNCTKCKSENIVMVEYAYPNPNRIDGWSELECKDCGVRVGRWTGRELVGDEYEPRYGETR